MEKSKKIKKKYVIISIAVLIMLILIKLSYCYYKEKPFNDFYTKSQNPCVRNIMKNRLTEEEVYQFFLFVEELKARPNTNILEFMSLEEATYINSVFALCNNIPASQSNNATQGTDVK